MKIIHSVLNLRSVHNGSTSNTVIYKFLIEGVEEDTIIM